MLIPLEPALSLLETAIWCTSPFVGPELERG